MKKLGLIGAAVIGMAVVTFLTIVVVQQNNKIQNLNSLANQKSQLEKKVKKLEQELSKFDGVVKDDLLKLCTTRAKNEYSDYIAKNSIAVKNGDTTTLYPKSPDTLGKASNNLKSSEQSCTDKFGG